ncbi:MAG TPA: hypothetical protein VNQ90_13875 [Chthoniobacteraceae bacterium]|nr:hypothetical protein [Chthoniobacteraceae bacterium]
MKPLAAPAPPPAPRASLLAPAGDGWRLLGGEGSPASPPHGPLEVLVPQLPAPSFRHVPGPLAVALPTRLAFLERMTLPSADREELEGMVLLQLEKTLPYPIEETAHRFEVIATHREAAAAPAPGADPAAEPPEPVVHSTVVAWAVHLPTLEAALGPLLAAGRHPSRLTFWAMHLAAAAGERPAAAFWQEEGEIVFAIFEKGRVSFAEIGENPEAAVASFPQWLLSAELAGAPVNFERLLIDPGLNAWRSALAAAARLQPEPLPLPGESVSGLPDLSPPGWRVLRRKAQNRLRLKKQLLIVAAVYAVVVAGFLGWSFLKRMELRRIESRLLAAQPEAEERLARELRWRTLAPAIDPDRSTVELLFRIQQCLPSQEVRITEFEQTPKSFMITGEAPSAAEAVGFLEKLKSSEGLREFELHADPPTLLPNDHAQFRIFGK